MYKQASARTCGYALRRTSVSDLEVADGRLKVKVLERRLSVVNGFSSQTLTVKFLQVPTPKSIFSYQSGDSSPETAYVVKSVVSSLPVVSILPSFVVFPVGNAFSLRMCPSTSAGTQIHGPERLEVSD